VYILYGKKLWQKSRCKALAKILWRMLTYIAIRQSSINNNTKPNKAIPNINEHNKTNSVFSSICLVPHASSMLFDDGERYVYIYVLSMTVESMICGYHKYISELLLESELDLLKYCIIDILTSILMQNRLKLTSCCCTRLMLQKQENWQKTGELEAICQIRPTFLSPKFFTIRYSNLWHDIWSELYDYCQKS